MTVDLNFVFLLRRFNKREEAQEAIAALNNVIPEGSNQPLTVRVAEEHGKAKAGHQQQIFGGGSNSPMGGGAGGMNMAAMNSMSNMNMMNGSSSGGAGGGMNYGQSIMHPNNSHQIMHHHRGRARLRFQNINPY